MRHRGFPSARVRLGAAVLALCAPGAARAQTAAPSAGAIDPALYSSLHWRGIGPYRGGRALAVTGVSGEPGLFYFGAAGGGVWRSINSGASWTPIFDPEPIASIGAIAVAPSNHQVIYVGTGEGALRGDITWGDGVYRSTDGGKTWTNVGLKDTRQIGALIVDPANPDIVLVAAIGHAFGPNAERGVFRTIDGGKTWSKVLYKDADTGAIDVTFDPHDSRIVYAALWQVRRQPWNFSSGGPGSGLYRSSDGGATWTQLQGGGLPTGVLGRIDIAVSGVDPRRVWAMIEAKDGGLYRSDDAGQTWRLVNTDGRLRQRAWYFSKIFADSKSADALYAVNTGLLKTADGGKTFTLVSATHGDHHGLWIDPADASRLIDANDGGASVSLDAGKTWSTQENQPTAAMYHVSTDADFPYRLYGAQQDNSNLAIASFDDEGVIGPRDWFPAGGGECGFVFADPRDRSIIYSSSENGINRFDKRSEQSQDISAFPGDFSGHPASELAQRFNWTSPLMMSPHDPDTIYWGSDVVWKSTDHGHSWTVISPDLTRDDKSKQIPSGGPLTKDITSVEYYDTVFALAESPLRRGILWAGSDDGLIHLTVDDGAHWGDVTPAAVPAWSTISMIEPSHFDPTAAYVAVDRHKLDDIAPYAFKTADAGKTWTPIVGGLPQGAVVHAVREDPVRRGLLYAGTEKGVFVSFDDGGAWRPIQLDLPSAPVHDLAVQGQDLVAATHGRSFWILDDVTPQRHVSCGMSAEPMVLFTPGVALRLHYPDEVDSRRPVGENPPAGAIIDYAFKAKPTGEVTVDIYDAQGALMRHLSSTHSDKIAQPPEWPDQIVPVDTIPANAGMNRLVWDLRMSDPEQIPGAYYSGPTPRGALAPPGRYLVKLVYAGQTRTAPLDLLADPRVKDSGPAIAAKTALAVATVKDIDRLHHAVNAIRKARTQLRGPGAPASLAAEAKAVDARMTPIEQALMQVDMKGSEANLAFPGMLNEQLATFALNLDDADTPPTAQALETWRRLHEQLDAQLALWDAVQKQDIAAYNAQAARAGAKPLDVAAR